MSKTLGLVGIILAGLGTLGVMVLQSQRSSDGAGEIAPASAGAGLEDGTDVSTSTDLAGGAQAAQAPEATPEREDEAALAAADAAEAEAEQTRRFEARYGALSVDGLMAEFRAATDRYSELMGQISDARFAQGDYEVIEGPGASRLPQRHSGPLAAYRFNKTDGTTKKTVMPASEYPELYELREASRWLEAEIKRRNDL